MALTPQSLWGGMFVSFSSPAPVENKKQEKTDYSALSRRQLKQEKNEQTG